MCGISAVIDYGKGLKNPAVAALAVNFFMADRGTDSVGISWAMHGQACVWKEVRSPKSFLIKRHGGLKNLKDVKVILSHNRNATSEVNFVNAHPFLSKQKKFALVHNGIVTDDDTMKKVLQLRHKFQGTCDSEILMHLMEDALPTYKSYWEAVKQVAIISEGATFLTITSKHKIVGFAEKERLYMLKSYGCILLGSERDALIKTWRRVGNGADFKTKMLYGVFCFWPDGRFKIDKQVAKDISKIDGFDDDDYAYIDTGNKGVIYNKSWGA